MQAAAKNAPALEEAKMLFSYNANVNSTSDDDSNDKSSLLKKQLKDQQKLIR